MENSIIVSAAAIFYHFMALKFKITEAVTFLDQVIIILASILEIEQHVAWHVYSSKGCFLLQITLLWKKIKTVKKMICVSLECFPPPPHLLFLNSLNTNVSLFS